MDSELTKISYTVASSFEKKNSLSFQLLFGEPAVKRPARQILPSTAGALDNYFVPGQIFGFRCRSMGKDFEKFDYALVLRACDFGERGTIVPGITPGAHVLVQTLTNTSLLRFISTLKKLLSNGINLANICDDKYLYLNHLLSMKIDTNFFVGELVEQGKRI
jgi:hypothetical protein